MTELSPSAEKPVIRLPNGTSLHLAASEILNDTGYIIEEIFNDQVYAHPGFELRPTDTIIDVGSHVGVFAHWAAPQIPQGRMICIEPTSAADAFEYSLAQNGITNVRLHRCAAGAPSSILEIVEYPLFASLNRSSQLGHSVFTWLLLAFYKPKYGQSPAQIRNVPCRSLEEIMVDESLEQCDLLKMDCEGGEFAILEHTSRPVLRRFRRIMMEFHVFHSTHSLRKLRDRFEADGFVVHVKNKWLRHLVRRTGMLWATRID